MLFSVIASIIMFFGIVFYSIFLQNIKKSVGFCAATFLIKLCLVVLLIAAFSLIFEEKITVSFVRGRIPKPD